jgi:hypothetical protein
MEHKNAIIKTSTKLNLKIKDSPRLSHNHSYSTKLYTTPIIRTLHTVFSTNEFTSKPITYIFNGA